MKILLITLLALLFCLFGCKQNNESISETNTGDVLNEMEFSEHHNSRIAVDWAGTYSGTLPAADGPGIIVEITLDWDETFEVSYQYLSHPEDVFAFNGRFSWDDAGRTITLDTDRIPNHYQVGENILFQLDLEGNRITGELAEMYILTKE